MGDDLNLLLALFQASIGLDPDRAADQREEAIRRFGFAVPTVEALDTIAEESPNGVVEIGAGTGYWAHLLSTRGVDVVAFDLLPPPSEDNTWVAGSEPWYPVRPSDHSVVADHPGRTLLLVWPTRKEMWAQQALDLYAHAGGQTVVYVGEPPGGRTGDDTFQARLGELSMCQHCRYGLTDVGCICDYPAHWERKSTVELPHWPGFNDDLYVYQRGTPSVGRRWGRRRR